MNLEEAREFFAGDRFATDAAGARIEDIGDDYARCSLEIRDIHRNATGNVMGGAVFTLADFALAVASNHGGTHTVSVSNTIEFIGATRGSRLVAEALADRVGRSLCFYSVTVRDDLGALIAKMSATMKRLGTSVR